MIFQYVFFICTCNLLINDVYNHSLSTVQFKNPTCQDMPHPLGYCRYASQKCKHTWSHRTSQNDSVMIWHNYIDIGQLNLESTVVNFIKPAYPGSPPPRQIKGSPRHIKGSLQTSRRVTSGPSLHQ